MKLAKLLLFGAFGVAVYELVKGAGSAISPATEPLDTTQNPVDLTPDTPTLDLTGPTTATVQMPIPNVILDPPTSVTMLAFGAKVSADFRSKVVAICRSLGIDPSWLMAVMYSETDGTFSPSIRNPLGSATGLLQFTQDNVSFLGVSLAQLASMSAVQQLDYVQKYLAYWQQVKGKLTSVGDVYMAVFNPAHLGQALSTVLYWQGSAGYTGNKGFDTATNPTPLGYITIGMVWTWANLKLAQGFLPGFVWVGVIQ